MCIVLIALGAAAMIAAALSLMNLSALGFPDGYITPYDRSMQPWVAGLAYALLVSGIFTLAAAVFARPRRAVVGAIVAVLLYGSLWAIETCPRLDRCTAAVLDLTGVMLDDGTGG